MAIATRDYGLFIGGESVEGAETRELAEPATGAALARAAMASPEDVDRAVESARAALEGPWAKTPPNERSRLIHALADAIVANRKELTELETRNVGKAVTSVKGEVAVSAEYFRWYASAIATIRAPPSSARMLAAWKPTLPRPWIETRLPSSPRLRPSRLTSASSSRASRMP